MWKMALVSQGEFSKVDLVCLQFVYYSGVLFAYTPCPTSKKWVKLYMTNSQAYFSDNWNLIVLFKQGNSVEREYSVHLTSLN
jgi:hypothetical protein